MADLDRSEAFYERVLGLVRRERGDGRVSLGPVGGDEPLLELVERPGVERVVPRSRLGLYHFALHVEGLGIPVGAADHDVSEALNLADPDGLGIEVYADRPRGVWRVRGNQLALATKPLDLDALVAEAGDEHFDGLPSGTVVGHVHFHVGDLDAAARFYHEALGFDKVVWDYPGALFCRRGDTITTWA